MSLMLQPTRVRLDFDGRTVREVVEELSRRGVTAIFLEETTRHSLGDRRLTLQAPEPLPLWEAIDRLSRKAGLHVGFGLQESAIGHPSQGVILFDARGRRLAPVFNSGPFRIKIVGSHYQRDQTFEPEPGDPDFPQAAELCQLQLQVMAEPRLRIAQHGAIRLTEASDERGQSLLTPALPSEMTLDAPNFFAANSGASVQYLLALRHPSEPGQRIVRLRGVLPLLLASRKPDPMEVPLAEAIGRSFVGDDLAVVIHGLHSDPNDPQWTLELTVRPPTSQESASRHPRPTARSLALSPDFLEHQVEVLDRGGKPFVIFPLEMRPLGDAYHLTLLLAPADGATAPAKLRIYGLTRTTINLAFEFIDVPMP